jgi:hypothetical protein
LLFLGRRVWQYISELKQNSDEQIHQKNVNVFCEIDSLGQKSISLARYTASNVLDFTGAV